MPDKLDAENYTDESKRTAKGAATGEKVGYKRPPRHTQFQPGQSGNPLGRPKQRRSFKMDMAAALDALTEGNRSKQQKLAENLVNGALAGNALALKIITSIALSIDNNGDDGDSEAMVLQQRLVEDFNRRQGASKTIRGGDDDELS